MKLSLPPFVLSAGVSLIGILMIIYAIHLTILSNQSLHWEQTTGLITQADVNQFCYQFTYKGQVFTSSRRIFGASTGSFGSAYRKKRASGIYKEGNSVTVFFDKNSPSDSTLTQGYSTDITTIYCFGGVIVLLAGSYLIFGNRNAEQGAAANP